MVRRPIDYDEPWRYRCPDCESILVEKLKRRMRIPGKKYSAIKGGKDIREDRDKVYRCDGCQTRLMTVYDAKVGNERRP